MIKCMLMVLVLSLGFLAPPADAQTPRPTSLAGRSTVYAPNGIAATSQPLATAAALAVLQRGGNAIDAAVTAAAVLAVVEPHMTGPGGDLFAMVWSEKERKLHGLNASGRSGSQLAREEVQRRGMNAVPSIGAGSVTVPGAVSGWAALLEKFGTLTFAEALEPAIRLAEEGFPVSPIISSQWQQEEAKLRRDPGARAVFLIEGQRAPKAGEWFSNTDMARSLKKLAGQGPAVLYGGELGQQLVQHLERQGGFLILDDLRQHRAEWVQPLHVDFRGYRVWQLPPNGQGLATLEMLRILEPFDLRSLGHNSAAYLHHLVEAKKLAFADIQKFVGDPDRMANPAARLLDDSFIRQRRLGLDPLRAADAPAPGKLRAGSDTIYLCTADRHGNMVSLINSIFEAFGSGVVVPGTGFALQNRGAGFTWEPNHPNSLAPGRRPFHTIIPGFVTRPVKQAQGGSHPSEEAWLSFGVMGGAMQPQGHVQLLLNLMVFGMDLQAAADAPRFRHLDGRRLILEPPIGDAVRKALAGLGHQIVNEQGFSFGGAQAILRLPRGWAAASDPRKDGMAAGY